MKTPREVLFSKHQSSKPKLDILRTEVLAGLSGGPLTQGQDPRARRGEAERISWLQLIQAVRWHLAGLSAVWGLIVIFKISNATVEPTAVAQAKQEPPPTAIALLKENRRQIMEMGDAALSSVPAIAPASSKSRRSCLQTDLAYA